jgi:HEAT repeats/PBS lyase HEAT-like repeat
MRYPKAGLSVLLVLALSPRGHAAPQVTGLVNAHAETRTVTGGLEREVRALLAGRTDRFWMGYVVPATGNHRSCCWSSSDETGCSGCRLEGDKGEGSFRANRSEPLPLEPRGRLRLLLRAEGGRVTRVRSVSEDCGLDAGGLSFVWIDGVRAADSVAFLSSLLSEGGEAGQKLEEGALSAIAGTADPAADTALDRFVAPDQSEHRRKQAAFWMGQARGAKGFATLSRLVRTDPSPQFREHVVFALTQSKEPGAIDQIIDVAKRDESGHVRGQALFWLAQSASRRAPAAIQSALTDDPEIEVKKKAVFALSQLPRDEGVPLLIRLAETHKSVEVRKQAMFWLGQSQDPRALQFFEAVLKR